MNDNHKSKARNRQFEKVKNCPGIFRVLVWNEEKSKYVDPRSFVPAKGMPFRAFRRVRVLGKWVQQARYFDSIQEAKTWKNENEPDVENVLLNSSYRVRDLIKDWQEWTKPPRLKETTWNGYQRDVHYLNPLGEAAVEELTAKDIDQWLICLKDPSVPKKYTRTSFCRELEMFTTILNWYREYKNERYHPPVLKRHRRDAVYKVKALKENLALSAEDVEHFLERLRLHHRPVYYHLAAFQVLCGARIGEACGLKWDCVDLKRKTVIIKRVCNWHYRTKEPKLREGTKTDEIRTVVLCDRLVEILANWKAQNEGVDLVFHNAGNLLKYNALQNAYKRAYAALGLPPRSTHVLRHTFATLYAEQTGDLRSTQYAMGHRDVRITQHYAKVSEQTQRGSIERFALGKLNPSSEIEVN